MRNIDTLTLTYALLNNAAEFLETWHNRRCPPPLILRSNYTIFHDWPTDPVYLLFREIFLENCYTGQSFYYPQENDTVLDVGANIGMFAIFLKHLQPNVTIHCFEPAFGTRARLVGNVERNGLSDSVRVLPYAVWSETSQKTLLDYRCSGRKSFFRDATEVADDSGETVECISLKTAIETTKAGRVNFLKVDVEGAELEVLNSVDKATWAKIDRTAIEYHEALRPGCKDAILRLLRNNGFSSIQILQSNTASLDVLGVIRAARMETGTNQTAQDSP